MKYIGFIVTVLILIGILFQRGKIDLRILKNTGITFLLSIPSFILVLLFFKFTLKMQPDKGITIAIYSSFILILLLIVITYLSGFLINKLISYQISVGNKEKELIKNIIKNKSRIISFVQIIFFVSGFVGLYGIWIKMK